MDSVQWAARGGCGSCTGDRKLFLTIATVCSLVAGQTEAAEAPDNSRLRLQVRRLVQQMDSDQIAKREAAEKELVKLGPDVLDHLPKITPQTPAEVTTRLERVRKQLQTKSAREGANASKVTLSGKMKLSEALASFRKQTGNKVVDLRKQFGQQEADVEVEVDFKDVPFWTAFDKLVDKAGLAVYSFSDDGDLGIIARPDDAMDRYGNARYSGLFRFEPVTIEASRQLRAQQGDVLRFKMEIAWEPRTRPIALSQTFDSIKVLDERGNAIAVGNQGGKFDVAVEANVAAAEILVPLELPGRDIKKISSFKGELIALVPGRVETFNFEDLAGRGIEQEKASVTVVLDQVRKNVDLYELRMRVRYDEASNALESHRGWIYQNEAVLVGPDGKVVENSGLQATLTAENEVGISYLFDVEDKLESYKFVYKTPAIIVRMPIQYELKNIALP